MNRETNIGDCGKRITEEKNLSQWARDKVIGVGHTLKDNEVLFFVNIILCNIM